MHHAARVLDAAHGAQILCSTAVRDDVDGHIRSEAKDLGLFRLRGVPAPMRLFQVDYDGMPRGGFPSPRTPAAFSHKLPASPTRFFGRDTELHDLAAMLRPEPPDGARLRYGRLVTLLGPGGTGKTRLSQAVGERLLTEYSHAVWFIPLAEVRDAQLLPEVLRTELEIAPEPGRMPLEQIVTMLAAQPSLLILDNFEQLVPAGGEVVRALLESVPQLVWPRDFASPAGIERRTGFQPRAIASTAVAGTPEEVLGYASVQLYCDRRARCVGIFNLPWTMRPM
jgi:hypothetical protein